MTFDIRDRLCRDCIHIRKDRCFAPQNLVTKIDPVTGNVGTKSRMFAFCDSHRGEKSSLLAIFLGLCGYRGRWFMPTPEGVTEIVDGEISFDGTEKKVTRRAANE